MRGSAAWKRARRGELQELIAVLGVPTFFLTLSAADSHRAALHDVIMRHLGGYHVDCNGEERDYTRMQGVVGNPHIVSAFFVRRQVGMLAEQYGGEMRDPWGIYEWQSRGSVHFHCLLWFNNTPARPVCDLLDTLKRAMAQAAWGRDLGDAEANEVMAEVLALDSDLCDGLQEWCGYYDQYITAVNPAVIVGVVDGEELPFDGPYYSHAPVERLPQLDKHICRHAAGELPDAQDFKYLANFCNHHIRCRPGVCLKPTKDGGEKCKVGAPWETSARTRFVVRKKKFVFVPRRNDPLAQQRPQTPHGGLARKL